MRIGSKRSNRTRASTISLRLDSIAGELAIERRRIDAERLGGARLVAALALQNPHDVRALYGLERWIRRRARRDERLDAALAHALRERFGADLLTRREDDRPLESVL